MHEMSISVNIIEIIKNEMVKNGATRLNTLKIKIGELTAVEPDSLKFCFEACTRGTALEGAALEVEEVPLMGRCGACKRDFRMDNYFMSPCPDCGIKADNIISGQELDIVSMEVD
ncbi:MAG: hydrogenase maturation nickel metallochaperone HypA [Deltaproteobacteria bacterium]|nr:hydrogenase maturation nickel metallochaperone HypA [Deltaproteobacteria bacterium]